MKKFIRKTVIFSIPFLLLNIYTFCFYSYNGSPDLLRIGSIPNIHPSYRKIFSNELKNKVLFTRLSEAENKDFKVLTIGDSFLEQFGYGFQNYLAKEYTVLHVDRFFGQKANQNNQISTLYKLVNGDFFDKYKVKYVVLEIVERYIIKHARETDSTKVLNVSGIDSAIRAYKPVKEEFPFKFSSNRLLAFPYYSFQFFCKDDYLFDEQVGKAKLTTSNLFDNGTSHLLFFQQDVNAVGRNNDSFSVSNLNSIINGISRKLAQKNIQLIFVPAPDKYDIYFDYILNKQQYPKPLFFEHLDKFQKDYLYVNSKAILQSALKVKKDIYYYDDTHWTPWAAQIIAQEIGKTIEENK